MKLKDLCLLKDLKIVLALDVAQNWMARIEPMLEVVDGSVLISICGRGEEIEDALNLLCNQISGHKVRLNRSTPAERFNLPNVVP